MKKLIALVVDDSEMVVRGAVNCVKGESFEVCGLVSWKGLVGPHSDEWSPRDAVVAADVIFLDHNMPEENGEQWLSSWKERVDMSSKIIIGTSSDPQPYLQDRISWSCDAAQCALEKICQEREMGKQ